MTIVTMAFCPVDRLKPTRGVAVVADTRLTKAGRKFDHGKKIFQIGSHAVYAYSGLTKAGIEPVDGLARFFSSNPFPSDSELTSEKLQGLLEAGTKYCRRDDSSTWYQAFVVFVNNAGSFTRYVYSPYQAEGQQFVRWVTSDGDGPWMMGVSPEIGRQILARTNDVVAENPHLEGTDDPQTTGILLLAATQWVACDDQVDPLIGGGVQGVVLTHQGCMQIELPSVASLEGRLWKPQALYPNPKKFPKSEF
jgi:hypothetical protein